MLKTRDFQTLPPCSLGGQQKVKRDIQPPFQGSTSTHPENGSSNLFRKRWYPPPGQQLVKPHKTAVSTLSIVKSWTFMSVKTVRNLVKIRIWNIPNASRQHIIAPGPYNFTFSKCLPVTLHSSSWFPSSFLLHLSFDWNLAWRPALLGFFWFRR
jgi:hypothetical protein